MAKKYRVEYEVLDDGRVIHPELGDLTAEVYAAIEEHNQAERIKAASDQLQIARENGVRERRNLSFGKVVAEVSLQHYLDQQRLEPGCWTDKGFIKDFTKHVPEAAVKSRSDRVGVGYGD
jgi:hypothetical protein